MRGAPVKHRSKAVSTTVARLARILVGARALVLCMSALPRSGRAGELKPYKVGCNAWIGSIAFIVAKEKGYFTEEGLDLQTKSFSSPGDGLNPLLTRDLDAVLSTADSVLTVLDKEPGQL